jgi:hypothetical protein
LGPDFSEKTLTQFRPPRLAAKPAAGLVDGHANARGDADDGIVENHRARAQGAAEGFGDRCGPGTRHTGKNDRHLFPAIPARKITFFRDGIDDLTHRSQHRIATKMAVNVVHFLEFVQIKHQEAQADALLFCKRELLGKVLIEGCAVAKFRKRVSRRLHLQLLILRLQIGGLLL